MAGFPRPANAFLDGYPYAVLALLGLGLLLLGRPQAVSAQDGGCLPSPHDAPAVTSLTDADVQNVRLEIHVNPDRPPAAGRAVLTLLTSIAGSDSVRLVTGGTTIDEVVSRDLDENLPFRTLSRDTIVVDLTALRDSMLVPRESITLELSLSAVPGVQFVDGFAWTIDPFLHGGAWYPWSGDLADRFTSELLLTVPGETFVAASGARLAQRETEDGETTFLFATSEPHAASSVVFAAGPYIAAESTGAVDVYHPGSLQFDPGLLARQALRTFESRLGYRYPYGRLSVAVVPGTMAVAPGTGIVLVSDNTLGTLASALPRPAAAQLADGIARQWFGGVVSPADWEDVWLTAGVSAYMAAVFLNETYDDDAFEVHMRDLERSYLDEARHYRRPVTWSAAAHPADLFDAHARAKSAWVMHTLRSNLDDEAFWKAIGLLLSWNQFGTVGTADLPRAVEAATGEKIGLFIDRWIHGAGHPELSASYTSDRDTLYLTVEQQQIGDDVPEVYTLDLAAEVGTLDGSVRFDVHLDELRETFALPFPSEPRYVALDVAERYVMDLRMEQSISAWIAQLRNASSARARLLAAEAVARRPGDPAVLLALRSALTQEPNPHIKAAILEVITELSQSDAAERALLLAYEDTSSVTRAAALDALAAYPASAQVEQLALRAANNDPAGDVQAAAVELLGRIESKEAVSVARAALITPSQNAVVRRAGLRVLGMRAETAGDFAVQAAADYSKPEHPEVVRLEAVDLLASLAPRVRRAESLLTELLNDPDWQIRLAAATALLNAGHEDAVRAYLDDEPISWLRIRLRHLLACD